MRIKFRGQFVFKGCEKLSKHCGFFYLSFQVKVLGNENGTGSFQRVSIKLRIQVCLAAHDVIIS